MTLKQIRAEKFPRSRSWIFDAIAKCRFPRAVNSGAGPNLWDEADIDSFLADYIAKAKAAKGEQLGAKRSAKALAARSHRREEARTAA